MKKAIWITYDFGFKGDYEGLYAWLDDYHAEECGKNTALLQYEADTDLFAELKDDLSKNVNLSKRDRIYVIWREKEKLLRGSGWVITDQYRMTEILMNSLIDTGFWFALYDSRDCQRVTVMKY